MQHLTIFLMHMMYIALFIDLKLILQNSIVFHFQALKSQSLSHLTPPLRATRSESGLPGMYTAQGELGVCLWLFCRGLFFCILGFVCSVIVVLFQRLSEYALLLNCNYVSYLFFSLP